MASVSDVFVHVGPLKTGTTFIQAVLYRNRSALADAGVLVPRPTFGAHVRSVLDLLGRRMHRDSDSEGGQWDVLVEEVAGADARAAVLSMEFLCNASPQAVKRMVTSLAPARVHVVWTARDLSKVLPAAWQTLLRNKQVPPWPVWVESVRETAGKPGSRGGLRAKLGGGESWGAHFWRQQDPRQSLAPYLEHVPADRVHVVTVPPSGAPPGLLWERFCAPLGIDPDAYDIDVPRANTSLGGAEAEVLRRVNQRVAGRVPGRVYADLVKSFVAREVLEPRQQSYPLVLPAGEHDWVRERAADAVEFLSTSGFTLHGDLADLTPAPPREGARAPQDVTDAEVLAVTEEALADALLEMARRQGLEAFAGPRSGEHPLPPPGDLGLSGEPDEEGRSRSGARSASSVPSVVALREALAAAGGSVPTRRRGPTGGGGPSDGAGGKGREQKGRRTGKQGKGKQGKGKQGKGKQATKKAATKARKRAAREADQAPE